VTFCFGFVGMDMNGYLEILQIFYAILHVFSNGQGNVLHLEIVSVGLFEKGTWS
jgi:hypothetical protein